MRGQRLVEACSRAIDIANVPTASAVDSCGGICIWLCAQAERCDRTAHLFVPRDCGLARSLGVVHAS